MEKSIHDNDDKMAGSTKRFEVHDPRNDVTYRRKTPFEAIKKAEEIGSGRILSQNQDGEWEHINKDKADGIWKHKDGRKFQAQEEKEIKTPRKDEDTQKKPIEPGNKIEADGDFVAPKNRTAPVIPQENERDFLQIGEKCFHGQDQKSLAFIDKGSQLETQNNDERTTDLMVKVASARGWKDIKVSGSEAFKKEAWLEASSLGMRVRGYIPNEQDKIELSRRIKSHTEESDEGMVPLGTEKKQEVDAQKRKEKAKTWRENNAEDAVKKYPDLINAAALAVAMDQHAKISGLTSEEREMVARRSKENIAARIENGTVPKMNVLEEIIVSKQVHQVETQEYER